MALRRCLRSLLIVLLVALLLPLNACGAESPAASSSAPSASASAPPTADPRPTPASSKGPARNLPKPILPEAAKENTKEGFEAFTQYWFDTITYGLETGDPEPLREISVPACKICDRYISRAESARTGREWNVGPRWTIREFLGVVETAPPHQASGTFLLEESSSNRYSSGGNLLKRFDSSRDGGPKTVRAIFSGQQWIMTEVGNG